MSSQKNGCYTSATDYFSPSFENLSQTTSGFHALSEPVSLLLAASSAFVRVTHADVILANYKTRRHAGVVIWFRFSSSLLQTELLISP
jgi:hypothetical protein